ncbi:MAG: preprotein translocase subunit SecE [Oscillospiraceae bacterium]|jgi:preprotein translocase subunit SecE|nr:preprotein translocase subunit SecE [Oscillospiraceae bacterium]
MSKKEPDSHASELEKERAQQAKEAKQKLKAAEKAKAEKDPKAKKDPKKTGKSILRFFKDFRGEIKKIIWPDFKTVMKNTGIVLMTVLIIGILVWVLDFGLTSSIKGLKKVAKNTKAPTSASQVAGETTTNPLLDINPQVDLVTETTEQPTS